MNAHTRILRSVSAILVLLTLMVLGPISISAAPSADHPTAAMFQVGGTEVPTEQPTGVPTEQPTEGPTLIPPTPMSTPFPTQLPPTGEATSDATEPGELLSSFYITKLFCETIDESAEEPCVGRVEEVEGTTVSFEVTDVEYGYSQIFDVEISEYNGFTVGSILIYDAPLGAYLITELVPDGFEGFAVPLHDGQVADGASITIEVGPVAEEEEAFFVNLPIGEEPIATPDPGPTEPADGTVPPNIQPPDVTPGTEVPIGSIDSTVAALPGTGTGDATSDSHWLLGLQIAAGAAIVMMAFSLRHRAGR